MYDRREIENIGRKKEENCNNNMIIIRGKKLY